MVIKSLFEININKLKIYDEWLSMYFIDLAVIKTKSHFNKYLIKFKIDTDVIIINKDIIIKDIIFKDIINKDK